MILSLIKQHNQLKSQRKKFIPFVNERNHMGNIIVSRPKQKSANKTIQVFQNLKKSSQQYFFDKKYQKMKIKLQRYKKSINPKQLDCDKEVQKCFRSIQKFRAIKSKNDDKQNYFVNLNEKLNDNIKTLRDEIVFKRNKDIQKQPKNISQLRQMHSSYCSLIVKNQKNSHESHYKQNRISSLLLNKQDQIKKPIFCKNSIMKDFIACSQKFKKLITKQKYDPWKKWYKQSDLQIFPGKTVRVKQLQKSIYG